MLRRFPLLPCAVSFAAGSALMGLTGWGRELWPVTLVFLGLSWISWARRDGTLTVFTLLCAVFFFGMQRTSSELHGTAPRGESLPGIPDEAQVYEGTVTSYPQQTERGYGFRVAVHSWGEGEHRHPVSAAAQVTLLGEPAPERGDRIRFRAVLRAPRNLGNDREFDFENYAKARGIDLTGTIADGNRWVEIAPAQGTVRRWLNVLRRQAVERAETYMEAPHFHLYKSLVLGERIRADAAVLQAFRSAGILHLLVVSGFHVALLAGIFSWLFFWLARRSVWIVERVPIWYVRALGGAAGAAFFCALTDLPVPTLRAFFAVLLALLAVTIGRGRDALAAWVTAALGLLLYQPLFLSDLSFQLSFLAVLGILMGAEAFPCRAVEGETAPRRIGRWTKTALVATAGATVATFPVLIFYFSRVTVWSFVGNLVFVPLLGAAGTAVGFAASFLAGPLHIAGDFLFCVLDRIFALLLPLLRGMNGLPGTDLWVPRLSAGQIAAYALFFFVLFFLKTGRLRPGKTASAGLVFSSAIFAVLFFAGPGRPANEIHFLHVGQGDAALLISNERKVILVDAGPGGGKSFDAGERVVVPWLKVHGFDRIDLMAVTHMDLDHAGGAKTVLEQLSVAEIWLPRDASSPLLPELQAIAERRGTFWRYADASLPPARVGNLRFTPVHPFPDAVETETGRNNRCLVAMAEMDGYRVLMAGDIEAPAETELVRRRADLRADVLKVPHHGSRTSSTKPFLDSVRPAGAVITAGWKNIYRHPAPEVVGRLEGRGIRVWRGDRCGEIRFRVSPESVTAGSVFPCGNSL